MKPQHIGARLRPYVPAPCKRPLVRVYGVRAGSFGVCMLSYGVLALCAYVLALRCKGCLVIRRYAVRVGLLSNGVSVLAYRVLLGAFNIRLVLCSGYFRKVVVISQRVVLVGDNLYAVKLLVSIPVQCEYYALEGIMQLINTIMLAQRKVNPNLDI